MVEKILQCPYCGSDNTKVSDFYGSWCGTCLDCEAKINDAVLLWNAASNALSKKDEEIARIADECDDLLGKLAFANAECDKLRAALNQTEDDRHETVGKLRLALIREANGYKRQDKLEAEIARLTEACDDLEGEYLRMKEQRDEALATRDAAVSKLSEMRTMWIGDVKMLQDRNGILLNQRDEARKVARHWYNWHNTEYKTVKLINDTFRTAMRDGVVIEVKFGNTGYPYLIPTRMRYYANESGQWLEPVYEADEEQKETTDKETP